MFLLKSIPPILLGTLLVKKVASHQRLNFAALALLVSALNVLILSFEESVFGIMVFSLVSSTAGSFTNTLITSFTSDKFNSDQIRSIFRKQIAINSGIFAFAPAAGGYLAAKFGVTMLYMMDFFSFLAAGALIMYCHRTAQKIESKLVRSESIENSAGSKYFNYIYIFSPLLVFVSLSSALDALEFPVMGLYLDPKGVGMVLSAWGIGSAIIFFAPNAWTRRISTKVLALIFVLGVTIFAALPSIEGMIVGFLLAGMSQVVINANLRSEIRDQITGSSSQLIWAKLNQYISFVNMLWFLVFAISLKYVDTMTAKWVLPVFGVLFVLVLFVWKKMNSGNEVAKDIVNARVDI
jgi:hypothetical protein